MKKKLLSLARNFRQKDNFIEDIFVFADKDKNLNIAYLRNARTKIYIHSFNLEGHSTGYIFVQVQPNKRLFLSEVYAYQQYRGKGVASALNDILSFALNDYEGYVIRGEYAPQQLSTDRDYKREVPLEELEKRARKFYKNAGFEILNVEEYKNNKENYPDYNYDDDFILYGSGESKQIVIKSVKKQENLPYTKIEGIYVKNDAIELANQEDEAE